MSTQTTTANDTQSQSEVSTKPDFGNGRYSPLMVEVYDDAQHIFKLEPAKAEKLARAIAQEIGAIMANRPVEVKLGKVSKDGKLTIAEASKVKGITMTYPVFALRALYYANEAGKNGFIRGSTQWKPVSSLVEYFNNL